MFNVQDDMICLSCTAAITGREGERVCLAAEGFGNRTCFLQSMANKVRVFTYGIVSVFI
jgi:ryanodine receptor 2